MELYDSRRPQSHDTFFSLSFKQCNEGVGHLSNDSCAEFAKELVENGTTRLILGHLSRENNEPLLAYQTTKAELDLSGALEGRDYILKVAKPVNDEGVMNI